MATTLLLTVEGTIYDVFNEPIAKVIVDAFDKDLRKETLVGTAVTDGEGHYIIRYAESIFLSAEKESADLFLRVFKVRPTGKREEIGKSKIHFNVPSAYTLDFKIDGTEYVGSSEFDTLLKTITPLVSNQGVQIAHLKEDEKFKDISFLSAECQIDASILSLLPLAFEHMTTTKKKIPADIFYGLFRMQFPKNLNELLLVQSESLIRGIEEAIKSNIISRKWAQQLNQIIEQFNFLSSNFILNAKNKENVSFRKMIGVTIPDRKLQKIFVDTYFATESNHENFWNELALKPGFMDGKIIVETKNLLRLNLLTNQPELAGHLYKLQEKDPDLKEIRGFAKLAKEDFEKHISAVAQTGTFRNFLKGIEGETRQQKIKNYAALLDEQINRLFPVDVFKNRLASDTQQPFDNAKGDLSKFLSNNPEFDLATTSINSTISKANLNGIRNKDRLVSTIKGINRVYKMSHRYEDTSVLLGDGLDSATKVIRTYSPREFGEKFDKKIGKQNASRIYNKAKRVDQEATIVALNRKSSQDVNIVAMMGENGPSSDYQSMFGDNHLCDCEHCQSANSPSAYLVDILNFIHNENSEAETLLNTRRPDIRNLLLTCNNTNTPLPYIDYVNELLADFITLEGIQAHQTTNTAAELAAFPEHENAKAYAELNKASTGVPFPSHLPLNIYLDATRLYLEKLDCKRDQLMVLFYGRKGENKYRDIDIATEYLNLSQQGLLELNKEFTLPDPDMIKVSEFLALTSLTYVEMLQLLECKFINPEVNSGSSEAIKIVAILDGDNKSLTTCNVNKLKLTKLTTPIFKEIFPFIRLWRHLGWNILDVDRLLKVLNIKTLLVTAVDLKNNLILPLSHICRIKDLFNFEISAIFAFWSEIDTARYRDHSQEEQEIPSLYAQLFQNKQISNPMDPDFKDPSMLSGKKLSGKSSLITAVYNISEGDFNLLTADLFTDDDLSLDKLSILYRHSILGKALGIKIEELLQLKKITGINPFGDINRANSLLEFIDTVHLIDHSDFSIDNLDVFLNKNVLNVSTVNENTIVTVLTALREGLKRITVQFPNIIEVNEEKNKLNTQRELITNTLSTEFNLAPSIVMDMLDGFVKFSGDNTQNSILPFLDETKEGYILSDGPIVTKNADNEIIWVFPDLVKTYISLYETGTRLVELMAKLSISTDEVSYFLKNESLLEIDGIWNVPTDDLVVDRFQALENLIQITQFREALLHRTEKWFSIFDFVTNDPADGKKGFIQSLVELSKISKEKFTFLLGSDSDVSDRGVLNYSFPENYIHGKNLLTLMQCINKSDQLGSTPAVLSELVQTDVTLETSEVAKSILKAKYEEKAWLDIIKPISNQLREIKRDALVSYILTSDTDAMVEFRDKNNITDSNSLFQHFLIDTEMAACMMTSRIKQANSSVQLFIDRCLMGLESSIKLGESFSNQWNTWRKQYRIWDANLRVLLETENWIEPDLRDNKSPFFKELESKLSQNEITDETAKDALLEYLEKLDTVANLEVIGFFNDELTGIEHFIGRTESQPHQYFYRTHKESLWSPWEKIELDIEGDHILPVVWNNRLMLFWGVFTEKQVANNKPATIKLSGENGEIKSEEPEKYFDMKLSWSEYKNGQWGAKKISDESIDTRHRHRRANRTPRIFLSASIKDKRLSIYPYWFLPSQDISLTWNYVKKTGFFFFENCNCEPTILKDARGKIFANTFENSLGGRFVKIKGTSFKFPFLVKDKKNELSVYETGILCDINTSRRNPEVTLFNNTPGYFRLLPDYHDIDQKKPVRFFYSNGQNNFYVYVEEKFFLDKYTSTEVSLQNSSNLAMVRNNIEPIPSGSFSAIPKGKNVMDFVDLQLTFGEMPVSSNVDVAPTYESTGKKKYYKFQTFYHPYICEFISKLNTDGIDALYKEAVQKRSNTIFSKAQYDPTNNVSKPHPVEEVDFSFTGAYSIYNWELFFHIPLLIATRLLQDQKFDKARYWLHKIFDPTKAGVTDTDVGAERFWITKPFKEEIKKGIQSIEELLNDETKSGEFAAQLAYSQKNAFKPHGIAQLRLSAYMRTTVMKYIDILMASGDQLFRRDSIESINEATLLYVLAANMLGKKPESVPARAKPQEVSYATLASLEQLENFTAAKVEIETYLSHSDSDSDSDNIESSGNPIETMSLFCIPRNTQLLKYWDTVADKLFKIRNCMNIDGEVRELPLFEARIDPGLLVRASAQGLDLNDILNSINAPLPHYRFQFMAQKASELCNYVKGLGSLLLSIFEKRDTEKLSLLRSGQEIDLLKFVRDIKVNQVNEAKENLNGINAARVITEEKYSYFDSKEYLNESEQTFFRLTKQSASMKKTAQIAYALVSIGHLVPNAKIGSGFTFGVTTGGGNLGHAAKVGVDSLELLARILDIEANVANIKGGNDRRQEDWNFQTKTAKLELKQIDKQITAAEIRLAIAEKELVNHDMQIENSKEVDAYMRSKFTNYDLYDWMAGQISSVYFQAYELAYDFAKKAERGYRFELGNEDSFISYGDWNSLKERLLSADHLLHDIHRMEASYIDNNKREYELMKNVSLSMLDPLALIQLKETGQCEFEIPEVLYDLDHTGQYFRRLKSVSISLPCIVGPHTSVSAKLTLKKSIYRNNNEDFGGGYAAIEPIENDGRFTKMSAATQSIATSTAQNDSGVFELNFSDSRYLPFEGEGATSTWILELPTIRQFDYYTIADVLLHIKYTAKEGGDQLKSEAEASLKEQLGKIQAGLQETGLHLAINLKNDLPNEWHSLSQNGTVDLKIDKSRLPYMAQTIDSEIEKIIFIAKVRDNSQTVFKINVRGFENDLNRMDDELQKLYKGNNVNIELNESFTLSMDQNQLNNLEEFLMVVKYNFL